jgi:hypothetical protein
MPEELDNLGTGDQDPAAEGQNPDGETMVPVSVVQAIRDELNTVKGQLQIYQTQLRMGMAAPQAQQAQPQPEEDYFPGIADDEPLTKKEAADAFKRAIGKVEARTTAMTDEASFLARHPDYHEVITEHLPKLFELKPELLGRLQRHPDPVLAYELGLGSPSYLAKQAKERIAADDKGKRAQANANKPGSSSQAAGQTGSSPGDRFARMSSKDFRAHMESVKRGGR